MIAARDTEVFRSSEGRVVTRLLPLVHVHGVLGCRGTLPFVTALATRCITYSYDPDALKDSMGKYIREARADASARSPEATDLISAEGCEVGLIFWSRRIHELFASYWSVHADNLVEELDLRGDPFLPHTRPVTLPASGPRPIWRAEVTSEAITIRPAASLT